MISDNVFIGLPLDFTSNIKVYPPLIKETLSNPLFEEYYSILTVSQINLIDMLTEKKVIEKLDKIPTPFEYLLINCHEDKTYEKVTKNAFKFFLHQEVTIIYDMGKILVGNLEEILLEDFSLNKLSELNFIDEKNFFSFQNYIRVCINQKEEKPYKKETNKRIEQIKAKARYRDRIKARQEQKNGKTLTFSTVLESICCIMPGVSPLNIGEMTYASVLRLLARYKYKSKFDLDIRQMLTFGNKQKITPKYWIENMSELEK